MIISQPYKNTLKKNHWSEFNLEGNLHTTLDFLQYLYAVFPIQNFEQYTFSKLKTFFFKKSNSLLCSFCKKKKEIDFHLYFYCINVRNFWNQLKFYLAEDLALPTWKQQTTVFSLSEKDNAENVILYNRLFLIFKLYFYRFWKKGVLSVMSLTNQIIKKI